MSLRHLETGDQVIRVNTTLHSHQKDTDGVEGKSRSFIGLQIPLHAPIPKNPLESGFERVPRLFSVFLHYLTSRGDVAIESKAVVGQLAVK